VAVDPFYSTKSRYPGRKDKWYHNVGEFILDPRNIGTAVGAYFGSGPGAAAGSAIGGMIPGVDFGPEDDARPSTLAAEGFGGKVSGVGMDAARGYGTYKLGELGVDKLQGAFADPLADAATVGAEQLPGVLGGEAATVGAGGYDPMAAMAQAQQVYPNKLAASGFSPSPGTIPRAAMPPDFGRVGPVGGGYGGYAPQGMAGGEPVFQIREGVQSLPTAQTFTDTLGQGAVEAPMSEFQRRQLDLLEKQGNMSTLEKAYMLTQGLGTLANLQGNVAQQRRYDQSRGPGNMFDVAMTDAFGQDRDRERVSSYDDYLRRVG
jgi:hypothetical protein